MWIREELKTRAKATLRLSYWKAFVVSLVLAIFCNTGSSGSSSANHQNVTQITRDFPDVVHSFGGVGFANSLFGMFVASFSIALILAVIAFGIFVSSPLEVGCRRYFTSACCYQFDLRSMGMAFHSGRYLNVVAAMLYRGVFNFLWYLLFVIPGIVKGYAYAMVPYILADNPNLGAKRALDLSQDMTRGHKWDMFVLDLSFIGWYLLGMLACGVGVLFVNPYADSTKAELYMALRHNAITAGQTSLEELCLN